MPEVREQINELLVQEMDRKRFLQYSGMAFLAAFGISGFITAVIAKQKTQNSRSTTGTMKGYGSSKFGKS